MTACSPRLALRISHATGTVVIGQDHDGVFRTYVLSPTGWRLRRGRVRGGGQLIIDPSLIALLDAAAAEVA